ncbi:MAG: response regulator [Desulfobacteraceae bacterium]|nr:response regulator [Desulfobacteraceae bacterium]
MARILIIDDEAMILDLLVKILEREGYETVTASGGKDGIKIHRENPADLIITDLIMAEKDGLETIMELRRDFQDVKIIAMSGGGKIDSKTYLQIAKTMGAIEIITKPFDLRELLRTVQELLE